MKITENLTENFPFISVINHTDKEYVGIIINQDSNITSMYNYELLKTDLEKQLLLELGESWWWESNRQIPINIFIGNEIQSLKYSIINLNTKDVEILYGPCTSLNNLVTKRVKRKSITLVRKTP